VQAAVLLAGALEAAALQHADRPRIDGIAERHDRGHRGLRESPARERAGRLGGVAAAAPGRDDAVAEFDASVYGRRAGEADVADDRVGLPLDDRPRAEALGRPRGRQEGQQVEEVGQGPGRVQCRAEQLFDLGPTLRQQRGDESGQRPQLEPLGAQRGAYDRYRESISSAKCSTIALRLSFIVGVISPSSAEKSRGRTANVLICS
jgi:hypothetical protein